MPAALVCGFLVVFEAALVLPQNRAKTTKTKKLVLLARTRLILVLGTSSAYYVTTTNCYYDYSAVTMMHTCQDHDAPL